MPENRPSASQRGYDSRWQKARKTFLASHPHCVMCAKQGMRTQAQHLDHIKPHKGDQALFWDRRNWQGLCALHHNATKARDERGHVRSAIGPDGWPIEA